MKEAITNAVIHRDYHAKRDITVNIYEDRVEVESPGLLPFNITKENIGFERALDYRNSLTVKHLSLKRPILSFKHGFCVLNNYI